MADISPTLIYHLIVFLSLPFILGFVSKKFSLPSVIGYLVGGLFLSLFFPNLKNQSAVMNLAYLGIVLLLFTIGLEVNIKQIISFRKIIIVIGILQLLLTSFFIAIFVQFFGFSLGQSFLVGILFSSSSTTLVAKILEEKGEEHTFLGQIAMGILIFQDIAFIPYMVLFSSITGGEGNLLLVTLTIVSSLLKSLALILLLWYLGFRLVPELFGKVAALSRELLDLFTLVFILIVTYLSLSLNLPVLVGVFVAGILVGQSIEHHQVFSRVIPLRNILAFIFFVYIGLSINFSVFLTYFYKIIGFAFLVILVKWLVVFVIFLSMKFHSKNAFLLATYLFQVDEDAFILSSVALGNKLISYEQYIIIISAVVVGLLLTPIFIENKENAYSKFRNLLRKFIPNLDMFLEKSLDSAISPIDVLNLKDHIIICGYGRMGSLIGRAFSDLGISYVAVDYNRSVVAQARAQGVNIIYGDPTNPQLLDFLETENARLLILALPSVFDQESVIINSRRINPDICIIARVHRQEDKKRLRDLGVDIIIQPETEASIIIIKHTLKMMNLPEELIKKSILRLRALI